MSSLQMRRINQSIANLFRTIKTLECQYLLKVSVPNILVFVLFFQMMLLTKVSIFQLALCNLFTPNIPSTIK